MSQNFNFFCQQAMFMCKGAKLEGATGARVPLVFIPRPEIIHICSSLFVSLPENLYIGAPLLFSPVWRQCSCGSPFSSLIGYKEMDGSPFSSKKV